MNNDILKQGKLTHLNLSNCDPFEIILQAIEVTTRWMPSHLQQGHIDKCETLPAGISLRGVKLNDHADEQARKAAKRHVIDRNVATKYFSFPPHNKSKTFYPLAFGLLATVP